MPLRGKEGANVNRVLSAAARLGVLICLFLLAAALIPPHTFAYWQAGNPPFRAYVDRNVLSVGEQFTLSLEFSGDATDLAETAAPPDLDEFARFQGGGSSRSIQFVNGRMSSTVTRNLYYIAERAGSFEIPPIEISGRGPFRSPNRLLLRSATARVPSLKNEGRSPFQVWRIKTSFCGPKYREGRSLKMKASWSPTVCTRA